MRNHNTQPTRRIVTAMAALTMVIATGAQAATVNFLNGPPISTGDFRIASITNIVISGTSYDAMFRYSTDFNSLPAPAITFTTQATADQAGADLASAINALNISASTGVTFTLAFLIPFNVTATDVSFTQNPFISLQPLTYSGLSGTFGQTLDTQRLNVDNAFVTFSRVQTSVVPLPAAAWMGMALLAGLGAAKKLRRRQA